MKHFVQQGCNNLQHLLATAGPLDYNQAGQERQKSEDKPEGHGKEITLRPIVIKVFVTHEARPEKKVRGQSEGFANERTGLQFAAS